MTLGFKVVLDGHSGCRHAMAHPLEEAAHAGIEVLFVCFYCFSGWLDKFFQIAKLSIIVSDSGCNRP